MVAFVRRWGGLAIGILALLGAVWWVTNSRIFDLRDLQVLGNHRLSDWQVRRLGGLDRPTNVAWFSAGTLERRLEASPWVLDARVTRSLPSAISVRLIERRPVALVAGRLVAGDGVVLGAAPAGARLPRLGREPAGLAEGKIRAGTPELAVAQAIPASELPRVARISARDRAEIEITMRDGVRVMFGKAARPAAKWAALVEVLEWADRSGTPVRYVDVRVPSLPALRPARPR